MINENPGLIGNAMGADIVAGQAAMPSQGAGQAPSQGADQAAPEEQQAYEKVVMAGAKILYDDKTHKKVMTMLESQSDDPPKALADVASLVITQVDEASKNTVPVEVIPRAAEEILQLTGELAETAGLFQVDEATIGVAMQHMLMQLAPQYGVEPEDIEQLMQSVNPNDLQAMVEQQTGYAQGAKKPLAGRPQVAGGSGEI